jgi:regulator of protease activity HflC (stomatin/prohibitin superfamily)
MTVDTPSRDALLELYGKGPDAIIDSVLEKFKALQATNGTGDVLRGQTPPLAQVRLDHKVLCSLLTKLTLGMRRFFIVPEAHRVIVTTFGRYYRVVSPGLGSCWSFWRMVQIPSDPIYVMQQRKDYPLEEVWTADGNKCNIDTVVFYSIQDVKKATFDVDDYKSSVQNVVEDTLLKSCGKMTVKELIASRDMLAEQLLEQLKIKTDSWGIEVKSVVIRGIEMMR